MWTVGSNPKERVLGKIRKPEGSPQNPDFFVISHCWSFRYFRRKRTAITLNPGKKWGDFKHRVKDDLATVAWEEGNAVMWSPKRSHHWCFCSIRNWQKPHFFSAGLFRTLSLYSPFYCIQWYIYSPVRFISMQKFNECK